MTLEKIKNSISLKIALLALIACGVSKIISMTTDFYIADLCMLASLYIASMCILFFGTATISNLLGENHFFRSIIVMIYLTIGAYYLYSLIGLTFLASYEMIVMAFDMTWKILICIDGVMVIYKFASLLFAKKPPEIKQTVKEPTTGEQEEDGQKEKQS